MIRVQEIMTANPKTTRLDQPLPEALDIMRSEDTGAVPVVDNNNILQGIVTDRDIALCLADNPSKAPQELLVRDAVQNTDVVVTVSPEEDINRAIQLMEENQVRRLPVRDEQGRCVGIVSQADIARENVSPQRTAEMVQGISQQRSGTLGSSNPT